jgi:hypothetical protein
MSMTMQATDDRDTRASMRVHGWDILQSSRDRQWYIEGSQARKGPFASRQAAEAAARGEAGDLAPYPGFGTDGKRVEVGR